MTGAAAWALGGVVVITALLLAGLALLEALADRADGEDDQ